MVDFPVSGVPVSGVRMSGSDDPADGSAAAVRRVIFDRPVGGAGVESAEVEF
jgi:hypothetical protein